MLQDFAALVVRFRKNLMIIGLYILIVSVIVFPFTGNVISRMSRDLLPQQQYSDQIFTLIQTQPLELMMLELKMSFIVGFIAALPIVFFYAYKFLLGRRIRDRFKISWPALLLATVIALILFIAGCAYSYFWMLPLVFKYLLESSLAAGIKNAWKVSEFVNFAMMTTFTFGLVFELPLVMTALARARIVPVAIFKKYRRHMYVIIMIVAALVTSPDVLTQIMVGVPLIIFYELSLLILRFTAPEQRKEIKV
ncbi:MAG TPA: twin-arginine translocase subunit TatC [Methanocella sp.]|nr:twin-arginine translocase subunit TatC [Methanocella sp.]